MHVQFIIPEEDNSPSYKGIYIPIGIAQLASILIEEGHTVIIDDLRIQNNKKIQVKGDAVCFSASLFSWRNIKELSAEVKLQSDVPVIIGGQYASIMPEKALAEKSIDYAVIGEGDSTLPELIAAIDTRKGAHAIKGICCRKGRDIVRTGARSAIEDLDSLPFPAMHLFDISKYRPNPKHSRYPAVIPMITGRGCPWAKCTFCYHPENEPYRRKSPARAVEEIKHYIELGAREIRFWDDCFIDGTGWADEFCNLLTEKKINIPWSCHSRASYANKETLNLLRKAGCWQVFFGIESGNQSLLDSISKGITLKLSENAIRWAREAGLETRASFILGLPGETPEMTDETIAFAKKISADITQFSLATPYPGTEMHERLSGELDPDNTEYTENEPVFLPKGYKSREQLMEKYRDAYKKIYLNPAYLLKSFLRMRTQDDLKRNATGLLSLIGLLQKR